MELNEHRCRNCGGQLIQDDANKWRCPYCNSRFEDSSISKHTENMSKLFDDAKREIVNNLRRNLYDATHAEFISSAEIHSACVAIKQYLPEDFQATFYEIAIGNNLKQLTKAIRKIDVNENRDDIESIIQFLIRSLQTDYLLELNNLIERAYKNKDLKKYEDYATQLSLEAEKVNLGVYETKFPRNAFIAYSSKDMDKVSELVEVLEAQGMKCFVAARNLRHGKGAVENYNKALEEAMDHCQSFVFVSTPNSRSMNCDALSIELPYIQSKDIDNSPAEYRNNYKAIPTRFKKPRVEYRIGEMSGQNAADAITSEFFDGYEWVYSPDEVAQRIMKQLIATPQAEPTQMKYMDMEQKKICAACGAENSINMKFCGECGKNEFVNSVSEFIKLRKMQEATEKAKNDAAIAEAEKAVEEARAEAEQAKRDAEAKAEKAAAAEKAKKDAEAKAKAAEEAKTKAAIANAGTTAGNSSSGVSTTSSSYAKPSYSSSSSSKPSSKKGSSVPLGCLIPGVALVVIALILTIISTVMNNKDENPTPDQTPGISDTPGNDDSTGSNSNSQYPNLSFTEANGGWEISANPEKIANIKGDLVIPSEYNGKAVVSIAENAFKGCSEITSVTVPDSVTKIGGGAFSGCSKIKSMTLPFVGQSNTAEGTETMFGFIFGEESYAGSSPTKQYYGGDSYQYREYYLPAQLTTITITNATQLGYAAFYNCSSLTSINLNDGIITVGDRAFTNCTGITEISLPDITAISNRMMQNCTSLKKFEIGDNVTKIASWAFDGCSNLSMINSDVDGAFVIGPQIVSIGSGAFSGCVKLTDLTIPFVGTTPAATGSDGQFGYIFGKESYAGGNLTSQFYGGDGYQHNDYYLPQLLRKVTVTHDSDLVYGAFNNCTELKEIILNAEIISIGDRAFENCSSITEIDLHSITTISSRAFMGCRSLESFTINPGVTTIASYAFKGCTGLLRINSDNNGEYVIESTVNSIGFGSFAGCEKLTHLTIPFVGLSDTASGTDAHLGYIFGSAEMSGTTKITQNYGTDSYQYETYYIPSKLTSVTVTHAQSLGFAAFHNCSMLTEINLHDNIISVGNWTFLNCSSIKTINLPSLLEISVSMLNSCTSLESFEIGDSVSTIGNYAFYGCLNLSRISSDVDGTFYINNKIKSIGKGVFNGCIKVKTLIVPFLGNTVTSSGGDAALGYVFGSDSFTGGTEIKQYYGKDSYQFNKFYIPNSLTGVVVTNCNGIGFGAFSNCTRLENIQINTSADGVVGDRAFENCTAKRVYKDFAEGDENNSDIFDING